MTNTTTTTAAPRGRLSVALVHHPVLNRFGEVQTTALTNLDVHDLARSSRTFGCAAYYVVTPIEAQLEQARAIVGYWEGDRGTSKNRDRSEAMSRVKVVVDVESAIAAEVAATATAPSSSSRRDVRRARCPTPSCVVGSTRGRTRSCCLAPATASPTACTPRRTWCSRR